MIVAEGMELTRGTKKIIQESINSVGHEHQSDRIRLCEEFCKIVESRYTGGAMGYQLKRMGNTYPFALLYKNDWSIQDALENNLVIYLDESWFVDSELVSINDKFYTLKQVIVEPINKNDNIDDLVNTSENISFDNLEDLGLTIAENVSLKSATNFKTINLLEPVPNEMNVTLDSKVNWLSSLVISKDSDGNPEYMTTNEILNFSKAQAKARGLLTGKESSVKIPLDTTGPILEAIDKYLYDKTGQYTI